MVFEQKKIQLEILSEYLRQAREDLQLSVEEVAAKSRISPKFLQSLEQGDFKHLPPDVYVFGFLRQVGELYGVDGQVLIAQFKKEKSIATQMQKRPVSERGWGHAKLHQLVITPKILSIAVGLAFVAVTLGYIIWQVASINQTPDLEIYQPQDRQIIKDSFVGVSGKTDSGDSVTVNGQDVFVDNSGNFQTQLSLENGPEPLTIVSSNKFNKSISKTISVIGEANMVASSTEVTLKLDFSNSGTLTYSLDNADNQTLGFHSGDTKVLTAQTKIVISTTDAGATAATLNGQSLGALGRSGEQLSNIPFFAENNLGK